jgi:hypothetical protein
MTDIQIEWEVTESAVSTTATELERNGANVEDDPAFAEAPLDGTAGFEPVMLLVATISVVGLAKALSAIVLDHTRPGIVVDTRTEPVTCRETRAVRSGTILLVTEDGEEVVAAPDDGSVESMLVETLGAVYV